MPRDANLHKVLVIGSGPIVIGQAAEFDYAGTQACRVLKEEGVKVVLANSNPATIMTDSSMADAIYIEPLTETILKRIIERERPDALLPTLGGQTGLTLSMRLARDGFLDAHGVRLLGASPEAIDRAEDRRLFKQTMESIGCPVISSEIVENVSDAVRFAEATGYPLIVRPAFTLGGSGGGMAADERELRRIASEGIRVSPIGQILVEKSVAGWKEIEFEVMRDRVGNAVTVCSMENFDPVGVHTGDSIVVAPALTLADKEYQMLRTAALDIVAAIGVEGGCNCQFALDPHSFDYAVIEVNPRVSRSSALASKAAGYPIAKVATRIALGYTLDEIENAVTGRTRACFEPALDYVAVKFPRWPFDKFSRAERSLGTRMQATGEVMALGDSFEMALMKAVRGAEISLETLHLPALENISDDELFMRLATPTDERLFQIFEMLRRGRAIKEIHAVTKVDRWFLSALANLAAYEAVIERGDLSEESYREGKRLGYTDGALERISGCEAPCRLSPSYKMVDTCAGEFAAATPYFYATYDGENEAGAPCDAEGKCVVVLGSGPIRIGQGIEFDYSSVHCVEAFRKLGFRVVIVNNNPETVSTDFDTADRLYFEPLCPEDVRRVLEGERPFGVVVAYGGQTAIKLAKYLDACGFRILGTPFDSIDLAEDRERFDALLEELGVDRPAGGNARDTQEAVAIAERLGYPVLVRPSYVLGGQGMNVAASEGDVRELMEAVLKSGVRGPVLVDKYLAGTEVEVDAICDAEEILIPGIMEHVERAGVHSGDSIAVTPPRNVSAAASECIVDCTRRIALAMKTRGLVNVQYIVRGDDVFVIEVNPRASRTIPYLSKVAGVPMVELATRTMTGERLRDMGYGVGLFTPPDCVAVKVPVFSFEKLRGADARLGPEMKSTGEVLGVAPSFEEALFKGLVAAGYRMDRRGGALFTVSAEDKTEVAAVARKYAALGFDLYATPATAECLRRAGIPATVVPKGRREKGNATEKLESGAVRYVVSTSAGRHDPDRESARLRSRAIALGIPCFTSLDTAVAVADALGCGFCEEDVILVDMGVTRERKFLPQSA